MRPAPRLLRRHAVIIRTGTTGIGNDAIPTGTTGIGNDAYASVGSADWPQHLVITTLPASATIERTCVSGAGM